MSEINRIPTNPLRAGTNLVRIAGTVWWRGTELSVQASVRVGSRVVKGAIEGEPPAALLGELGSEAQHVALRVLGLLDQGLREADAVIDVQETAKEPERRSDPADELRRRGIELLTRSADVRQADDAHPAYARILGELHPDEARVLRFLCAAGPQPAVDVRSARTLGVGGSLVAAGLTMIGEAAGCRWVERLPAYLNNLFRLGLIWFSREALPDPTRYQVLEAQPDVGEALEKAGRGRTVRRSIMLTPFGEDFCAVCLPPNELPALES